MGKSAMTENLDSKTSSNRKRNRRFAATAVAVAALSFAAGGFVFSHAGNSLDHSAAAAA
jgi:hypothetical protein